MKWRNSFAASVFLACLVAATPPKKVDFARDIRPILSDNCFACHGPDEKTRLMGIRLDTREGAFAKGPNGPLIVPGDPAASRLFARISHTNAAMRMPPPATGRKLTDAQVDLFRRWIEEGAKWETHWSYEPPRRPALPEVKDAKWPRTAIDRFILGRLDREGLTPQPEASRATLIRRVSLDLTGLPPTPAEVDAFVKDTSPNAYEKVVDRLLDSPHYGERMAMMWLDLARYADTHGYHIDSHRDMYHWRDWVIRAFQKNMPFDQFTIEQLAGDLLAKPTRDQLIATGFQRNHMINFEGGAIPEEYHVEYVVDRVETTSTVWMGMTTGCARCHDHKYDPIKQREFYEMFAFFNQVSEKGLDGRRGNAEPVLKLTTPLDRAMLDEVTGVLAAREQALADKIVAPIEKDWEPKSSLPQPPAEGLTLHLPFENSLDGKAQPARGEITYADGPAARAAVMSGESQMNIDAGTALDGDPFTAAIWLRSGSTREVGLLQKVDSPDRRRGVEIILEESYHIGDLVRGAHVKIRLTSEWPSNAIEVRAKKPMPVSAKEYGSSWRHVVVSHDGSGKASGISLFVDGARQEVEIVKDALSGTIRNDSPLSIGDKALGATPFKGTIDDLRIYTRPLTPDEARQLAVIEPVRATMALVPPDKRSKEQKDRQREYFLTYSAPVDLRKAYSDFIAVRSQRDRLLKSIPDTMIMDELSKPRDTYVLGRGDYRNKTVKVQPGVPSMLPPLGAELPRNRLGLARWLVSPDHPLTARVTVNRFWQMYFGVGLVKTVEDFGSQGEAPSHPELLDWLATEFIQSGWDVRALNRLIVTSAAYRQSSKTTPELVEKDPENRLLAHGPRFRMPAEVVRDNALAASGLLNRAVGGPSVYPYQPPGVWEEISYGDVYSAQTYEQSKGEDLYRRSMYSFWKRTAPPPAMATFDAPDREKCIARRARTNTPLQALVVMNDPTFIEASRVLAEKALASQTPAARIHSMTRRVMARPATAAEIGALSNLATQQLAHYRRNPTEAAALLAVGASKRAAKAPAAELAAWTTVASAIFNLDEALTKE